MWIDASLGVVVGVLLWKYGSSSSSSSSRSSSSSFGYSQLGTNVYNSANASYSGICANNNTTTTTTTTTNTYLSNINMNANTNTNTDNTSTIKIYATFGEALFFYCQLAHRRLLIDALEWFNQSPGGVKLNPLITHKMGQVLTFACTTFGRALAYVCVSLHAPIIKLIACCGALGFTLQLVLVIDIIRVLTLHVAIIHRILALQHQFQLQLVYSLWHLFRGQKKNILRHRVDSCAYDQHQVRLFLHMRFVHAYTHTHTHTHSHTHSSSSAH